MRINHNISAMITQGAGFRMERDLKTSLERLSTGLRINRAADDAAGLSVSEQMRTQVTGGQMAERNTNDAISFLRIADGALNEVGNCLQRMRELAIQGSNDTLTRTERAYLEKEYEALRNEMERIVKTTTYNGITLFEKNTGLASVGNAEEGRYGQAVLHLETVEKLGFNPLSGIANISYEEGQTGNDNTGGRVFSFQIGANKANAVGTAQTRDLYDSNNMLNIALPDMSLTAILLQNYYGMIVDFGGGLTVEQYREDAEEFDHRLNDTDAENLAYTKDGLTAAYLSEFGAITWSRSAEQVSMDTIAIIDGNGRGADLEGGAEEHVTGLRRVNAVRSYIGATINRLEHSLTNLQNQNVNTQEAEARIRDVDFADETSTFTRNQILSQASTAMLAQANTVPQSVLSLIGR